MKRHLNKNTQPQIEFPVFNNWSAVAEAWYVVGEASDLKNQRVLGYDLCGQRVVVFRDKRGQLAAMDAFCPHMGTDLSIGKVVGSELQCFFHHWRFNAEGENTAIPCGEASPEGAHLQPYAVQEKYGLLWIYPAAEAPIQVPQFPDLRDRKVIAVRGPVIPRQVHPHISMINGIDAQHLATVHNIHMDMAIETVEADEGRVIGYHLQGDLPKKGLLSRGVRWVLGGRYGYSMRYVQGSVGLLTVLEHVRWFGRWPATPLRMIFTYTPNAFGDSTTRCLYLAERHAGLFGGLRARVRLGLMWLGFQFLRHEDGQVYDNIRFNPKSLLKVDKNVARFIGFINRLPLSIWSNNEE